MQKRTRDRRACFHVGEADNDCEGAAIAGVRILHVIPSLSAAHGGPSAAMMLIEGGLARRRIVVETATTDDDGPGRRKPRENGAPVADNGVIRRYFRKRVDFYTVAPSFVWWIFRHVRDYRLVHIHALFSFTSVVAAIAARRSGVPYIVRPLGTLNRYGVTQRRPWLKRLSLAWIEGPILKHADAVQFTSKAERLEAEKLGIPVRGVVIPLGVEPFVKVSESVALKRFPTLSGMRIVLFLSRLDRKKNVEGLLRAFSLLRHDVQDALLVIAGDGRADYVADLRTMSEEFGVADRVVWAGYVDGELKGSLLSIASVFVLPSFSENFGIAATEALMAGLPCVLANGVAISDDAQHAGASLSVEPIAQSIADGLRQLLSNEDRRRAMAAAAAELAQRQFSIDAMGSKLASLYASLVTAQKR